MTNKTKIFGILLVASIFAMSTISLVSANEETLVHQTSYKLEESATIKLGESVVLGDELKIKYLSMPDDGRYIKAVVYIMNEGVETQLNTIRLNKEREFVYGGYIIDLNEMNRERISISAKKDMSAYTQIKEEYKLIAVYEIEEGEIYIINDKLHIGVLNIDSESISAANAPIMELSLSLDANSENTHQFTVVRGEAIEYEEYKVVFVNTYSDVIKIFVTETQAAHPEQDITVELEGIQEQSKNMLDVDDNPATNEVKDIQETYRMKFVVGASTSTDSTKIKIYPGGTAIKSFQESDGRIKSGEISVAEGIELILQKDESVNKIMLSTNAEKLETYIEEGQVTARTRVQLTASEEGLTASTAYGQKKLHILPEQASEIAQEVLSEKFDSFELKTVGKKLVYEGSVNKSYKLFGIIPLESEVRIQLDAENGETVAISKPWLMLFSTE